jgi:hypothetical protein
LVALGNLIVAFNDVEIFIRNFIGYLLRISHIETEIVTHNLHWDALLSRLYALYEAQVLQPEMQKELSDIIRELRKCNERRNEFIHGEWTLGFEDDMPIFKKPEINSRFKQNPPPEDPDKAALRFVHPDKVNQLVNDLRKSESRLRDVKIKLKHFRHMNPPPTFLIRWQNEDDIQ